MERGVQVIDFVDPHPLASFWESALAYQPADPPEGSDTWEEWLGKIGKRAPAT